MLKEIEGILGEFARRYKHSTFGLVLVQSALEFCQTLSAGSKEHVQTE